MDQSELIEQFCAITASDAETAERYLAVADQNLEAAITLFLEGGGQSFASQQQPPQSNVNSGPTVSAGSSVGAGAIDEDDEALVRRLQQEEYNSTDNDGVREAIRPVTETLVEPGYGGAGFGSRYRAPPVQRPREIVASTLMMRMTTDTVVEAVAATASTMIITTTMTMKRRRLMMWIRK